MTKQLPLFKGWTVDVRLKQFRRIILNEIEFMDFDSEEGVKFLNEYITIIESEELNNFIHYF